MTSPSRLSVKIHDKTQLEIISTCDFSSLNKESRYVRKQKYNLDFYFFFPPQLNINKTTYTKEDFYDDIRPLIRLKEPTYSFKDYIKGKEPGETSPFKIWKDHLEKVIETKDKTLVRALRSELKILACSISSYTTSAGKDISKELKVFSKNSKDVSTNTLFFEKALELIKEIFYVYRSWDLIFQRLRNFEEDYLANIREEVVFLDENLLHIFERMVSRILFNFDKHLANFETKKAIFFNRRLQAFYRILNRNAKKRNYQRLHLDSSIPEKESYSMRASYLKKRMWQVLYLEVKNKASLFKKRQISYIAAAGFAAIWALFANFLIWRELNFQGYNSFLDYTDSFWGLSSYILILAFVSAYILKDRIKDFLRDQFQGSVFRHLPDSSEQIWYRDKVTHKKKSIGTIYESKQYIDKESAVPEEVLNFRKGNLDRRFLSQEDIVHYHKSIILDTNKIKKLGRDLTAVTDILRLSVKRYITRLDDPEEINYLMSKEGKINVTMLPKVYYVDLVIKSSQPNLKPIFKCQRILLNKEGLVRVIKA